jgi:hypothetical protein
MRIAIRTALLAVLAAACGIGAADPVVADTVAKISSMERGLPWFWSPAGEGLADIPYTYEALITRRILTRGGKEIPPAANAGGLSNYRSLQLERIPLDWGSHMRCLSVDGTSPCRGEWNQEFDRETKRRDDLTPEDRKRIDAGREARRERRRGFWDDFPVALRFETAGANQLRFSPASGYKPQHGVHNGILTAITGQLWFDPATGEVTLMEYDLIRDVEEPFLRLPKGSHFEVTTKQAAEKHYFPERILVRRQTGKAGLIEEQTTAFSKFKRFDSESKIEFGDPKDPGKH